MEYRSPWEQIQDHNANYRKNNGPVTLAGKQYKNPYTPKFSEPTQKLTKNFTPMKGIKNFIGKNKKKIGEIITAIGFVAVLGSGLNFVTQSQAESYEEYIATQPQYSNIYATDSNGNNIHLTYQQAIEKQNQDVAALAYQYATLENSKDNIPEERIIELAEKAVANDQNSINLSDEEKLIEGNKLIDKAREYTQYPDEMLKTIVDTKGLNQDGAIAYEVIKQK